jgi:hypothetical protein
MLSYSRFTSTNPTEYGSDPDQGPLHYPNHSNFQGQGLTLCSNHIWTLLLYLLGLKSECWFDIYHCVMVYIVGSFHVCYSSRVLQVTKQHYFQVFWAFLYNFFFKAEK